MIRPEIRKKFDEYFSTGHVSDPTTNPTPEELMAYLVEHAPIVCTYEMMRDYFGKEQAFQSALTRWGLIFDADAFTRNYTVRRVNNR